MPLYCKEMRRKAGTRGGEYMNRGEEVFRGLVAIEMIGK